MGFIISKSKPGLDNRKRLAGRLVECDDLYETRGGRIIAIYDGNKQIVFQSRSALIMSVITFISPIYEGFVSPASSRKSSYEK